MPGLSQSGCVKKLPEKMGNGGRDPSDPKHTTVPDGIKAPETKFMGNPRGMSASHSPTEEGNMPSIGCTIQGHFGKAANGGTRRYSDTGLKVFLPAQFHTHAYEKPDTLNDNFPLGMIAGHNLPSAEMAAVFIPEQALQFSIRSLFPLATGELRARLAVS